MNSNHWRSPRSAVQHRLALMAPDDSYAVTNPARTSAQAARYAIIHEHSDRTRVSSCSQSASRHLWWHQVGLAIDQPVTAAMPACLRHLDFSTIETLL